jgi:hypothetical protein
MAREYFFQKRLLRRVIFSRMANYRPPYKFISANSLSVPKTRITKPHPTAFMGGGGGLATIAPSRVVRCFPGKQKTSHDAAAAALNAEVCEIYTDMEIGGGDKP